MRIAPGDHDSPDTSDSFAASAILPLIQRPSRYANGELNLSNDGYRDGRFNVLLVFPDVYEIGMSHQGIRFLYHRLAELPGVGVELAFAPWTDAARLMRVSGEPLRSLATGTPAARFDVIGFSVTYELHYTNILMALDLAGLSLEAGSRREDDPIVIAGGPCCTNPLPFIAAIDAVFLGDGEDSLPEAIRALAELKEARATRASRREALARIEGVYVEGASSSVAARTHRFAPGDHPRRPIVPSSEVVHQRLAIEVMRGCARGCRFCHAGAFYLPCRERSVDEVMSAVLEGLDWTGWDEVSLLSLSTSDYSRLDELLTRLVPELERRTVSLALPSLRPETITSGIVAASATATKSGFTLAPEAGTERLRRVIRKDFSDEEIVHGIAKILGSGWQTIKLYFMIGLPTETVEDLDGIAGLIERVLALPRPRGRFNLNVSISPFVPKPHTPFQWERQCSIEEFRAKEARLAGRIRSRFVHLSLREPSVSVLEGILARGDRRMWPALRRAYDLGCRFDGWREEQRFDLWRQALDESGFEIDRLIAARPLDEPLPWDAFELHGTRGLLRRERERAYEGSSASNGPPAVGSARAPRADRPATIGEGSSRETPGREAPPVVFRYRFLFEKRGRARFLSHIEMMNVIQRALRRSKLPLHFTEGFHPHPRISAGPSLAVGMEGLGEFFDVEFVGEAAPTGRAGSTGEATPTPELLNRFLPAGLRIKACTGPFERKAGKLPPEARFTYLLRFDALRELMKSSCAPSEKLSETGRMWYLLGNELGLPGNIVLFECGSPVDPAQWFEAEWRRMFERGASIRNEKGAERSCAGCSVRSAADRSADDSPFAAGADTSVSRGSLELVIPGAEGAPRPQDLLQVFLPKNIASLVSIQRVEIRYKCEEGFKDPVEVIEVKLPRT